MLPMSGSLEPKSILVQKDVVVSSKLKCAAGLAALDGKKYRVAAKRFTEVSPELGAQWSEVISAQDVALYGGLCALASFDRPELRRSVIDNVAFREFLELYPEVREVVHSFYGSNYAACLAQLDRLQPTLCLDLYLHAHLQPLLQAVRWVYIETVGRIARVRLCQP